VSEFSEFTRFVRSVLLLYVSASLVIIEVKTEIMADDAPPQETVESKYGEWFSIHH
jgi:hypothetical protein